MSFNFVAAQWPVCRRVTNALTEKLEQPASRMTMSDLGVSAFNTAGVEIGKVDWTGSGWVQGKEGGSAAIKLDLTKD